ncbi:nuclear transport factor 2 family protein [Streptomyces sp. NPDC058382]|uniref:nuclear transport factor 2 family protein n=1 Tax=unclassified Streptomyces TaxID=2593676 RepID=UPI00363AAC20
MTAVLGPAAVPERRGPAGAGAPTRSAGMSRGASSPGADDLADPYAVDAVDAVDAVHEFPFTAPGFSPSLSGREGGAPYRAAWGAGPLRVFAIRDVFVHGTTDPDGVVAEHVVVVEPAGGAWAPIPGLLIIDVGDGLIARVRDHTDGLAVARAGASGAGTHGG